MVLPLGFRSVASSWPAGAFVGRIIPKVNSAMKKSIFQCEIELFNPPDIQITQWWSPKPWRMRKTLQDMKTQSVFHSLPLCFSSGKDLKQFPLKRLFQVTWPQMSNICTDFWQHSRCSVQREIKPKEILISLVEDKWNSIQNGSHPCQRLLPFEFPVLKNIWIP